MPKVKSLKLQLKPGCIYRRADLKELSGDVDRELAQLVHAQVLVKLWRGVYECPKRSRFGLLPPSPWKLVQAFLRGDDFLLASPNDFNALGVGTTQLYNCQIVFNRRRQGRFELAGQIFEFHKRPDVPRRITPEFLLVELVNSLPWLAEDREMVRANVKSKMSTMCSDRLRSAIKKFSTSQARKFFEEKLHPQANHAQ